jgi:hypothetical protein
MEVMRDILADDDGLAVDQERLRVEAECSVEDGRESRARCG